MNRSNQVSTSLENIGIKATPLTKKELIKYLADYYNPNMEDASSVKGDITASNLSNINS